MVARRAFRDRIGMGAFLAKPASGCKNSAMETPPSLEQALADCGLALVELEKFRAAQRGAVPALRARALTIGHHARRLHRDRRLDDRTVAANLVDDALTVRTRLREAAHRLRATPTYRAAVEAHRAGRHGDLAALLPALFEGLEFVPAPPPLFHPIPWLRRNRPRPPADIAADLVHLRQHGVEADSDALAPGLDPDLPAVPLTMEPGGGNPVLIRFQPGRLPPAVFRLRPAARFLVHVAHLTAPFTVIAPKTLDPEELGEVSIDHPRYRERLLEAFAARGIAAGAA